MNVGASHNIDIDIDPRVLGQLLLMQSVIVSLPDAAISSFVVSGLHDVPGVASVRFEAERREECGGLFCFPLATEAFFHGALAVDVADIDAFSPYIDYVRNFCFMVAVILEERRQRQLNEQELERQVKARTAQLAAEMTAREQAERLLRNIIDTSPDLIFVKDRDLRTMVCNRAFASAMGKKPEEMVGYTDVENGWAPELVKGFERDDRQALNGNLTHNPQDLANINGEIRIFDTYKLPLCDHKGDIVGLLGVSRDVTERIEVEKRLRESEARFRSVAESAIDAIVTCNGLGEVVSWNKGAEHMFGRQAEEMLGHSVEIIMPEHLREAHRRGMSRGADSHGSHIIGKLSEFTALHKSGREFPVELMVSKWEIDGAPFFSAIIRDTSERKLAESKALRAEQRNAVVLRTSPIAIAIARVADGRFVEVNDAFVNLFGRKREELVGRTSVEVGYWPDNKTRLDWLEALNREGELSGYEVILCAGDGGHRAILMSSAFIEFAGEQCVVNFIHDITERKKTEEALRQSNAELESFAYISSHDLREPLRNVTSFSTLLGRRLEGRLSEEEKEFLQIIKDGALRMDSLIRDILDFSRVGRLYDPVATADVGDVLRVVLTNMRSQMEAAGAEVTTQGQLPSLRASRNELESLFQNLIANAIKYRNPEIAPQISISCERKEQMWLFQVRDNGIGLEAGRDYEKRIFRLFQRLHQRNEYGGGTGVGLALCKKVVERHGGHIWAESPGPNQGTRFFFTLPV
jgi:PAS domain S-box-containing protein